MSQKPTFATTANFTPSPRRADLSRQLTSDHIRDHLAAFEASGGKVEVLGTTNVLRRLATSPVVKPSST